RIRRPRRRHAADDLRACCPEAHVGRKARRGPRRHATGGVTAPQGAAAGRPGGPAPGGQPLHLPGRPTPPADHARLPRSVLGPRSGSLQARRRTGGYVISVKKQIVVETSQQRAFRTFTDGIDRWWPREHHIGTSPLERMVVEPRVGGRWYSICKD